MNNATFNKIQETAWKTSLSTDIEVLMTSKSENLFKALTEEKGETEEQAYVFNTIPFSALLKERFVQDKTLNKSMELLSTYISKTFSGKGVRPEYWPGWAHLPGTYSPVVQDNEITELVREHTNRVLRSIPSSMRKIKKQIFCEDPKKTRVMLFDSCFAVEQLFSQYCGKAVDYVYNGIPVNLLFSRSLNYDGNSVAFSGLFCGLNEGAHTYSSILFKKIIHTSLKNTKAALTEDRNYVYYYFDFYTLILLVSYIRDPKLFNLNNPISFFSKYFKELYKKCSNPHIQDSFNRNTGLFILVPKNLFAERVLDLDRFKVKHSPRHSPIVSEAEYEHAKDVKLTNKQFFDYEGLVANRQGPLMTQLNDGLARIKHIKPLKPIAEELTNV